MDRVSAFPFPFFLFCFLFSTVLVAKETISVPRGSFQMGCSKLDSNCDVDEGPSGGIIVKLPAFEIDKYEVTVEQYQNCISAGKCGTPKDHKRNKYCNLNAPDRNKHPINCVDWQEAKSYCAW